MTAAIATVGRTRLAPFIAGLLISLAGILLIGEAYARLSLPRDIRDQLGLGVARTGIYKPDLELGADYRSYEDFRAENAFRLDQLGPLDSPRPTWLFLGNSFVQGAGNMADTASRMHPDRRIFALREDILLPLRAAQARQLLNAGLRPLRIFFVILPIDLLQIGKRPLSFIDVSPQGAITTRMRWPNPPWTDVVWASRLATIAWIRSGRADGDPSFDRNLVGTTPSPRVLQDLSRIIDHLAATSRRFDAPVTVVTIPNREQIFSQSSFGFQDSVREISRRAQIDYHDARGPFVDAADKPSLFQPDWHFSERGNTLLMQDLLDHLAALKAL